MDPIVIMMMTSAAMNFLKTALPEVQKALSNGEIDAKEQAKVLAEYTDLRDHLAEKFSGSEWEQSGRTQ